MTGRKDRERQALNRLADALADDILNTSDEDILAELREEGIDPDQLAADMRTRFEKTVIAANKSKLIAAKAAVAADRGRKSAGAAVPIDMAQARRRLRSVMESQPMTLAARNETEMTDSEVVGVLEDLKELGVLPPDEEA